MIHYFDTSALVKKYLEEPHSDKVLAAMQSSRILVTSAFTELEMTSWIERAKRDGIINSPTYRLIVSNLEKDFGQSTLNLIAISAPIMKEAKRIIKQRRLRSPDAIQLATALQAKETYQSTFRFVCFDEELNEAAKAEGLQGL